MRRSSSTSSSRRLRGWSCAAVFALALVATLAASAWHLRVYGVSRTREDRVAHIAGSMRGVEAEAIVLADSVTTTPAYLAKPAPGVYPFLTNGWLRLLGQYLLFHRFLEHNHAKRMFLFIIPGEFTADIPDEAGSGLGRYTYVDSIFTAADEKRILDEGGAHPKVEIDPRFELMLKTWYPNRMPHPLALGLFTVPPSSAPVQPDAAPRMRLALPAQANYALHRFEDDCRTHHVECAIVQAPTGPGVLRYDMTDLGHRFPGLRFVDTHDFAQYPAEGFPDGMHMDRPTSMRYLSLIQTHVAPLFASSPTSWDGGKVEFSMPEAQVIFSSATYHPSEGWGAWTSAATLAMRFSVSRDLRGGALRIGLRTPPQPGNAPVPVSIWLDGQKLAEIVSPNMLPREVDVALEGKELSAGTPHELELRLPHSVNLRASGMSPDPRDLGPGIISITFCAAAGCSPPA
jgi:hypothetical protein